MMNDDKMDCDAIKLVLPPKNIKAERIIILIVMC